MLRILNKNKEPVQGLDRYKQLRITKRLQFDDKTLEFNALIGDIANLENEGYIETETDRFVVKEIRPSSDGTADVLAQLDVETLEGKTFVRFETVEKTLSEAMALAFAGTGWTVGECNITKLRTLRKENCTSLDMLKQALSVYRCECKINSKQMTVSFYEEIGEDRGVYFMSDLNLRSLTVTKSSYDFYTEIEPYGANGMTIEDVNDGSKILTNYTYSNKSKRIIWKDERYTVPESLKEDAQAKLNDYSKPYVSYMADVVDLASMSDYYSILQYDIGDTITLADNATGTREKQRIVEMVVYPEEPELNSCVFANTTLTFEELAAKFSETADTVDNITLDNGTIDGSKINSFDAQKLSNFDNVLAASGVFGTLVANHAAFEEATVSRFQTNEANITTLQANYADVAIARIGVLETNYGSIRTLLAGNTAVEEAQMINLTANNAKIDEAFLRSVIAASITANDLKAGTIYTNKHTVQSEDGALMMTGSLLTFKDANGTTRIQIGKDGQDNYNYYLADADGHITWDAAGITKYGVPDGLIVDDMVANSDTDSGGTYQGISASKLNIHSMVGALNEEGGLKSSSIVMDEDNQSLTVAFSNLKSNVDNMSFGGRNLIKNTLNPDVSAPEKYPRLIGQTVNTYVTGGSNTDFTVSTHGFKAEAKNNGNRLVVRFGTTNVSAATMQGLSAGETYTLSFDAEWELMSENTDDSKTYYLSCRLSDDNKSTGTIATDAVYAYGELTPENKGKKMSARVEWTFVVPDNVTMLCLYPAICTSGDTSHYVAGNYIELRNLKLEKGNRASDWSPAPEDYLTETAKLNDLIDGIQDQIDGVIDTYYYDYEPTLTNVPASDWTATDYPSHKGDMFLDTSTGKSYQFLQDEQTQTWSWVEIPDTASAQALVAAQNALDVADHKRRVFVDTPSAPYDVGDLWFTGAGGDILTCTTAKTANQQYDQADWSKLHKYTDDTYASNKYAELTSTIDGVTSRVGTLETTTTNQGKTIASHTSTLEQTATKLSAIITDSQIAELESGTNMYDKLTVVKATADGASSSVSSLNIWKDTASGKIESLESQQNTFEQTLTGTTSRVSKIEKDYLTTSAAQTLIDQSAESVTIAVNRTIDGIKVGGRNLIINTLDPDVSKAANYPRLVGQESNTAVPGGTKTVAEHGMKIEVSSATRPYIRFGSNSASSGKMNGLEAGQTYTLSFDAKWKVLSGTITSTANYYMRAYLYTDAAKEGTFANTEYFAFATITPDDRGDEMSGRCEFTFTVPETAKMLYLLVQPSLSTSSAYASGNYIELRNIKLEKGNKCTDWTAAPEDYAGKGDALNDVVVEYATGDSPSTAPSTGWGTGSPTWTQGKYIWQRTAVTKNGQTTYSNVSCIQGAKGEAGEAVSIYSTEIKYQAHTSGTSAPTGTWQDTVPTVAQGAYLWTRTKVSYSDGTSTTSYSVGRMGSNGTNGNDGTDGISPTVTSTVTKYQQSTSGTTTPTGTWQTTPPTATAGQYMWTQTTVTYSDGATAVSYGVSRNGTNGKGISSITEYYVCTNSTSAPADSAFSTGVKTPTAAAPYLWNYEKVTYTDNSTKNLDKHIVAMYGAVGADGADGRSITGITEYYAVNNSTTAPADSDFGTAVKTVTASNKYLWNYEVVSYSTGNPTTTAKRIIGTYGDKGDKGDKGEDGSAGLNQATLYLYQRATSAPTKPSATITYTFASKAFSGINNGWSTAIPSGTNPCWVTVAVASANTASDTIASSEWTDPVKMVENGADGKDGKDGTDGTNGTNGIDGYNQATINLYKRSASTPAKPSTAVTYTFASGALSANPNGWTKTIPATDGNPCWVVSAAAISKDATASLTSASWSSPVKMVEDGTDGEKGDTGVGISKVTPQYCWHTNETTAPTTGWSSEKTTAPTGKPYLWIRSMVEYDDGISEPTTALCDKTLNDLQTRMTTAEQKITDDAIISTVSTRYGIGDANLIYNSTGYGGSTDGWELSPVKDGYALSSTQDSTRPGKTDYALSVKAASTSTDYVYMRQTQAHWITVEQGKKYTISGFYFRGSKVRAQCYVGVEYSTNNGKSWSTSSYGTYGVSMTASATWTSFSKTFTAPSNLIRVGVVMAGSTSASSSYMVQVSDLVLVRGETAMPWAESPTSLIEQTSDMIRLKAEKLVWTANNSSLTEEGELTVTKGLIGGFTIDDTAIFTKTKDSTSSGAILISTSDVSRTVAGKSRQSVRLAVGQNFGVLTDGTLIARNVDLSGTIAATKGSIGGIKIGTDGFYTEVNSGTVDGRQYKRYFSISKRGEFIQYRDVTPESYDPTEERYWEVDNPYRTGYLYISKTGEIKSQNYSNGYWRTDGRTLRGREERDGPNGEIAHNYDAYEEWARDPDYAIRFYAPTRSSDETSFAISIEDVEDDHLYDKLIPDDYVYHQYPFLVRYGGSVQCTALTVMDISSGTGSTVVANSSGKLFRSSSSKRYKDYIADMTEDEAEKLYDLPVVQFKYKDGYLDREDEMYDKPMHGFFAEDVADLFEDGGIHNNFGDVENYSERAIIARLVKLVQMQHEEIESLKASMQ